MDTAVITTTYPDAYKYMADLTTALMAQDDREFDFIVIERDTPANAKIDGVKFCDRYEKLLFIDGDDYPASNWVSTVKKLLDEHSIVFCDLEMFWDSGRREWFMSKRFNNGDRVFMQDIDNKNCLGFGNTAIRTDILTDEDLTLPDNIIAADWAFYTRILKRGHKAVFTDDTHINYRQHNNNTAGPRRMDMAQIIRGIDVKIQHYTYFNDPRANEYRKIRNSAEYIRKVKANVPEFPLWWEAII